ncbi:hypothetical protein [Natrinema marinum]|nr:hypothetical protein [Natrinema marinum]
MPSLPIPRSDVLEAAAETYEASAIHDVVEPSAVTETPIADL